MNKIHKYFYIVILLLTSCYISAQVTVGSKDAPVQGALLDLKEQLPDASNVTATKGLLLPKVELKYADALIMGNNILSNSEYKKHIGLIVYNISPIPFCKNGTSIHGKGIYVWNGYEWNPLVDSNSNNEMYADPDRVWVTNDQEGSDFRAARFGEQIWMIDNLSVKKYDTESEWVSILGNAANLAGPTAPGGNNMFTEARWVYPGPAGRFIINGKEYEGNGMNDTFYKENKNFGLLYNWISATGDISEAYNSRKITNNISQWQSIGGSIGSNEVENIQLLKYGKSYIQGICPNGWHLPSDREWNILLNEVFMNPDKYSYITQEEKDSWIPNTWQDLWYEWKPSIQGNEFQGLIGGNSALNSKETSLAAAFNSSCLSPYQELTDEFIKGKSFLSSDGGFNVLPTGDIILSGSRYYGMRTSFYTSSSAGVGLDGTTPLAITRGFFFTKELPGYKGYMLAAHISNTKPFSSDYNAIRCVYHGDGNFKIGMPNYWQDMEMFSK